MLYETHSHVLSGWTSAAGLKWHSLHFEWVAHDILWVEKVHFDLIVFDNLKLISETKLKGQSIEILNHGTDYSNLAFETNKGYYEFSFKLETKGPTQLNQPSLGFSEMAVYYCNLVAQTTRPKNRLLWGALHYGMFLILFVLIYSIKKLSKKQKLIYKTQTNNTWKSIYTFYV